MLPERQCESPDLSDLLSSLVTLLNDTSRNCCDNQAPEDQWILPAFEYSNLDLSSFHGLTLSLSGIKEIRIKLKKHPQNLEVCKP